MNTIELMTLLAVGLMTVAGVSAAIYVCLPVSILNSAGRHGRYAGLSPSAPRGDRPRGDRRRGAAVSAKVGGGFCGPVCPDGSSI